VNLNAKICIQIQIRIPKSAFRGKNPDVKTFKHPKNPSNYSKFPPKKFKTSNKKKNFNAKVKSESINQSDKDE
jgi:hypothetical protein